MKQSNSPFGAYYHPEIGGNIDSYLLDSPPEKVLKYRIGFQFGGYKKFSEAGCGLTELQISQVVCGRRALTYQQALKLATMLELPVAYLMVHFGPKKEETQDVE